MTSGAKCKPADGGKGVTFADGRKNDNEGGSELDNIVSKFINDGE